jgi:hypothetical protein
MVGMPGRFGTRKFNMSLRRGQRARLGPRKTDGAVAPILALGPPNRVFLPPEGLGKADRPTSQPLRPLTKACTAVRMMRATTGHPLRVGVPSFSAKVRVPWTNLSRVRRSWRRRWFT